MDSSTNSYAYAPLAGAGRNEARTGPVDVLTTNALSSYYAVTGQDLINKLEEDREQVTNTMGILGGALGFLILGPVGALLLGGAYAMITNEDLKLREKIVRDEMEGRLEEPISASSNSTHLLNSITEESPQATAMVEYRAANTTGTATGNDLRHQREKNRKRATVAMGVVGGVVGLILIGPLAAVAIGAGNALITKHGLMRRRKGNRWKRDKQDENRLFEPLLDTKNE